MTIDRRKFLTTAALGAVGTMIPLDKEAEAGNVSGYQPRFVMIFDQNKCVGCGACKEACSETNNVPAGQLRMTLERQSPLDGTPGNRKYVRVSCQQCSEPPCVRVCPTGAAHIDPATNIVTMDNDRCVGCKYCIAGCDANNPNSYVNKVLAVKDTVRVRAMLGTQPNLHYIPIIKKGV